MVEKECNMNKTLKKLENTNSLAARIIEIYPEMVDMSEMKLFDCKEMQVNDTVNNDNDNVTLFVRIEPKVEEELVDVKDSVFTEDKFIKTIKPTQEIDFNVVVRLERLNDSLVKSLTCGEIKHFQLDKRRLLKCHQTATQEEETKQFENFEEEKYVNLVNLAKNNGKTRLSKDRADMTDQAGAPVQQIKEPCKQHKLFDQQPKKMVKLQQKSVNYSTGNGQVEHMCTKRVKCLKCFKGITPSPYVLKQHAKCHIKEEIQWLFWCLLCPRYNSCFMHKISLDNHFQKKHTGVKAVKGTNYIDRGLEIAPVLEKMVESCFKGQISHCDFCSCITGRKTDVSVPDEKSTSLSAPIGYPNQQQQEVIINPVIKKVNNNCEGKIACDEGPRNETKGHFFTSSVIVEKSAPNHFIPKLKLWKKCLKCGKFFAQNRRADMFSHARQHLKTDNKIRQQSVKCLLCNPQRYISSLRWFKEHFRKIHKKNYDDGTSIVGVDYLDRRSEVQQLLNAEFKSCFQLNYKKPLVANRLLNKRVSSSKIKVACKICCKSFSAQSVSHMNQNLERHVSRHLQAETGMKYLYSCLMCKKEKVYTSFDKYYLKFHLRYTHKLGHQIQLLNTHYSSDENKFKEEILNVYKKCFPDLVF